MSKKQKSKFITSDILESAIKNSFIKLDLRYMVKNPVMFVVEIGFFITLLLSFFSGIFGEQDGDLRSYNIIVSVILFITILFANFAEAVAEGRGKTQDASLKKTQKDTTARLLDSAGNESIVSATKLRKDDVVLVKMGEVIPNDGVIAPFVGIKLIDMAIAPLLSIIKL